MLVAPAAAAALTNGEILIIGHILDDLSVFRISDNGASGYGNDNVRTVFAVALGALAVAAGLCYELSLVSESEKSVGALVDTEDNITAVTAVSAVGTALSNVLLASEGHGSVAAGTCFYVYFNFINKQFFSSFLFGA